MLNHTLWNSQRYKPKSVFFPLSSLEVNSYNTWASLSEGDSSQWQGNTCEKRQLEEQMMACGEAEGNSIQQVTVPAGKLPRGSWRWHRNLLSDTDYLQLDYGCEVSSGGVYSGWMPRLRLTGSRPESMDFINRNVKTNPNQFHPSSLCTICMAACGAKFNSLNVVSSLKII